MAHFSSTGFRSSSLQSPSRLSAFQDIDNQLIRCDIVFGMPSQDCRGTGICKLTSDVLPSFSLNKECRRTVAFASKAQDSQTLSLVFFRELLCTELFRRHFWKGTLEMREPCPLPTDLVADLGLTGAFLIPGAYPIREHEGCFRVDVVCGF